MSRGESGAEPAGLSQLNLNAAGIDVGATSHFVAVPADRAEPVREFEASRPTCTAWPTADGVPGGDRGRVHRSLLDPGVLEERGVEVTLVDPRRIKVPGRKTDLDCQLQQLHTYGLLSA